MSAGGLFQRSLARGTLRSFERRASAAVGHSGHLAAGASLDSLRNQHDTPAHAAGLLHKHAYLFDLNGFLVVKNVFDADMVARANTAIDAHADRMKARVGKLRTSALYGRESTELRGDGSTGRMDLGGMLGWEAPHREPFRELLCHPKVAPLLTELLGVGYLSIHYVYISIYLYKICTSL